jgi:hypothetical protein
MADGDDLHNPFEGGEKKKRKQRGAFDPDYQGDDSDPFKQRPDDSRWDEPEDVPSTRDA